MVKGRKIRCFFTSTVKTKPNITLTRNFIHSQASGGFWAAVRDLSMKERLVNDAVGHDTVVTFVVGFNPKILSRWEELTILDEYDNSYKIREKPDEYDYTKGDLKIVAYKFRDDKTYGGADTYDN